MKKNLIFSKMAPTILIKFREFIVHSKPNNMTLSAFPGKIPQTGRYFKHFYFRATLGVKEVLQSSKNSTSIFFMIFGSTPLPQSKNVF